MNELCKNCPNLKCLYYSHNGSFDLEENIRTRYDIEKSPLLEYSFDAKDTFHHLESIRMYFNGRNSEDLTKDTFKAMVESYFIAKCPKLNEIKIKSDVERRRKYVGTYPNMVGLVYDVMTVSIFSIPFRNFYSKDSCLIEQKYFQEDEII